MTDLAPLLFSAISTDDMALAKALLDKGVSPNSARLSVSETAKSALWWAGAAKHKHIFELLLAHGADVHQYSNDGEVGYPNLLAVTAWDTDLSIQLIERGVDPHDFSPLGLNYMWYAARERNLVLMRHLTSIGVEVDPDPMRQTKRGQYEYSIVHSAAQLFNPDLLNLAIELGGNVAVRGVLGMTALHSAAHHVTNRLPQKGAFAQVLASLLKLGLHIDEIDDHGNTPLHYAVGHTPYGAKYVSQPEIIKGLLDAGADPKLKNRRGFKPVDVADKQGVETLRNYRGNHPVQGG